MKKLKLYRGITVHPDQEESIVDKIKKTGLSGDEGTYKVKILDVNGVQTNIEAYRTDPSSYSRLRDEESKWTGKGIFASGSLDGAAYYAQKHNFSEKTGNTIPLIISFEAPINSLYVDGRDFLITAFSIFDRHSKDFIESQTDALKVIFGKEIESYFKKCLSSSIPDRINLGNISCYDINIIEHHYKNTLPISGRCETYFHSAFCVSAPIAPRSIIDVERAKYFYPHSKGYTLEDFTSGKPT
jgi:hypothetical protein